MLEVPAMETRPDAPPWPLASATRRERRDAERRIIEFVAVVMDHEITAGVERANSIPLTHDEFEHAAKMDRDRRAAEVAEIALEVARNRPEGKRGPGRPKGARELKARRVARSPIHLAERMVPLAERILEEAYPDKLKNKIRPHALRAVVHYLDDDRITVKKLENKIDRPTKNRRHA